MGLHADFADRPTFPSFAQFYTQTYGHVVTDLRMGGSMGAALIAARQTRGDWSDAASPDIVLGRMTSASVRAEVDHGAGLFGGTLARGSFGLQPPGVPTRVFVAGRHDLQLLSMPYATLLNFVGPEEADLPADGDFGRLHANFFADDQLGAVFDLLWRDALAGSPGGALFFDGAVLQVAGLLQGLARQRRAPPTGGLAPWQLRRLIDHMDAHLDEDMPLARLAGLVDLSPWHLCRAFRQSTGQPPHVWLRRRRIERAQEMIRRDPACPLIEVGLAVGYTTASSFSAAFRACTGLSPSQWRSRL